MRCTSNGKQAAARQRVNRGVRCSPREPLERGLGFHQVFLNLLAAARNTYQLSVRTSARQQRTPPNAPVKDWAISRRAQHILVHAALATLALRPQAAKSLLQLVDSAKRTLMHVHDASVSVVAMRAHQTHLIHVCFAGSAMRTESSRGGLVGDGCATPNTR